DPGRHLDVYDALLEESGATAAAVIDTHMHADYLSGARVATARWQVPYFLHPDDARSPYDGVAGRLAYQPLTDGDTVACGRATRRDPATFRAWVGAHTPARPDSYRTIKLANLGLVTVSEADAEILEFGPNQCAVS